MRQLSPPEPELHIVAAASLGKMPRIIFSVLGVSYVVVYLCFVNGCLFSFKHEQDSGAKAIGEVSTVR